MPCRDGHGVAQRRLRRERTALGEALTGRCRPITSRREAANGDPLAPQGQSVYCFRMPELQTGQRPEPIEPLR